MVDEYGHSANSEDGGPLQTDCGGGVAAGGDLLDSPRLWTLSDCSSSLAERSRRPSLLSCVSTLRQQEPQQEEGQEVVLSSDSERWEGDVRNAVQAEMDEAPASRVLNFQWKHVGRLPTEFFAPSGDLQAAFLAGNRFEGVVFPPSWSETLEILDLSCNELRHFPNIDGCRVLHTLILSNNQLTSAASDGEVCPKLVELQLSSNRLKCLKGLHRFPGLLRLDLANNLIANKAALRSLSAWRELCALALTWKSFVGRRWPGLQRGSVCDAA
eukprot:TRINITY_DN18508_c0_g1_i2.p2 TRINITY_DN18508_c0_g1~~TRINITY_DN18508_c0_g1_i2.p2  ORF type:complete len:270 (+),score=61.05 TRINITY_DN18508_c0_g1_i2:108-917(+)